MPKIDNFLVDKEDSIKEAMKVIDASGQGIAFVTEGQKKLFGVVTDGDIRRAILKGINIKKPVGKIANRNPIVVKSRQEIDEIRNKRMPIAFGLFKIPIVDEENIIKDIVFINVGRDKNTVLPEPGAKIKNSSVKKVLVIGGAGYLGSVLSRGLLDNGYKVRVLDDFSYGKKGVENLAKNKNFDILNGDIRNISDIIQATKGVDAVVHLAAVVGDPACAAEPEKTLEVNYFATKNIVEICKHFQINRFIFASTCSVYGRTDGNKKLTESSPLSPQSLYAETKLKCEQSILDSMDENFSPVILRMGTLYGYSPMMRFDLAVNLLTAKAIFQKEITIFGGEQQRSWLHLKDAASAYIKCLQAPLKKSKGQVFNVLSENHKIIEVGRIINSVFPKATLKIDKKISDKRSYQASIEKISKALDFRPQKKIIDGVIEIKNSVKKGLIKNYKDKKYRTP